jgi:hypothetical protein
MEKLFDVLNSCLNIPVSLGYITADREFAKDCRFAAVCFERRVALDDSHREVLLSFRDTVFLTYLLSAYT